MRHPMLGHAMGMGWLRNDQAAADQRARPEAASTRPMCPSHRDSMSEGLGRSGDIQI